MINSGTYKAGAFTLCVLVAVFTVFPMPAGISLVAYALPVVVCLLLPAVKIPGETRFTGAVIGFSICGAAIYLALFFLAGLLLKEIAGTPYDLSPLGILTNIGNILPLLLLREVCREYCLGTIKRFGRWQKTGIVVLILFMVISSVNFVRISKITEFEKLFIYIAADVMPMITRQILQTILVYYGGAAAGFFYPAVIEIFLHIFPFLPDLPWLAESSLGIAFPIFMAVFIREMYGVLQRKAKRLEKEDASFYVSVIAAVAFCWFCVGVFPVYPSVVLTGSMEPMIYPGDVILIKKVKEEKDIYALAVDDVINFDQEKINITHRIIEVIYDEAGNISFRTKGDNNKSPDQNLVNPNHVNGIVEKTVPKAGIPLLIFKTGEKIPEGVIDNEEGSLD